MAKPAVKPIGDHAYKGYLIHKLFAAGYAISKNGAHIAYANSLDDARNTIDQLT